MEMLIIALLAITLVAIITAYAIRSYQEEKARRKPTCIVYLMRIDEHGKIDIKRSPKQDMWNWKF